MHILVTRAESDAGALASRLAALGHTTLISPLLDIALLPLRVDFADGCDAILATSRNGLLALRGSRDALDASQALPIITVGSATAALARDMGFGDVVAGPGTAADLIPLIDQRFGATAGRFAHLSGDHIAFDLAGALSERGHHVQSVAAYRSIAAQTLRVEALRDLEDGRIDAVILMSPRTARIWSDIVNAVQMPAATLTHICLSGAVAKAVFPGAITRVAAAPTLDAVVREVERLAGNQKGR